MDTAHMRPCQACRQPTTFIILRGCYNCGIYEEAYLCDNHTNLACNYTDFCIPCGEWTILLETRYLPTGEQHSIP